MRSIAQYLGRALSDEVVAKIKNATSIARMKTTPSGNHTQLSDFERFFRKGDIGSWKDQLTVARGEEFDRHYWEHMDGQSIRFICELIDNRRDKNYF